MTPRILSLLIGYCFGLFQTAYIYGRAHGVDIRTVGSGNAGTTNTLRTFGKTAGLVVFIGDCLKAILASVCVWAIFHNSYPEIMPCLRLYAGLGCIAGHNYPFYMKFKGGKGVACTAGLIMSFSWQLTLVGIFVFFIALGLTHYVSLASLLLGAEFMIGTIFMGKMGLFHMAQANLMELYVLVAIVVGQMYVRHAGNIGRLKNGTERKTYFFSKGKNT
ncbi:MAG: glycerol-3-phosphate 1-O-acyltransferase PlsY [Lachnospiraceae bacterium]|nr:glycerol-3-phosphate 1-O-acyltransferase PlsY [Lachnospiraceae bacterium]